MAVAELLKELRRSRADDAVTTPGRTRRPRGHVRSFLKALSGEAPGYWFGRKPGKTPRAVRRIELTDNRFPGPHAKRENNCRRLTISATIQL